MTQNTRKRYKITSKNARKKRIEKKSGMILRLENERQRDQMKTILSTANANTIQKNNA